MNRVLLNLLYTTMILNWLSNVCDRDIELWLVFSKELKACWEEGAEKSTPCLDAALRVQSIQTSCWSHRKLLLDGEGPRSIDSRTPLSLDRLASETFFLPKHHFWKWTVLQLPYNGWVRSLLQFCFTCFTPLFWSLLTYPVLRLIKKGLRGRGGIIRMEHRF